MQKPQATPAKPTRANVMLAGSRRAPGTDAAPTDPAVTNRVPADPSLTNMEPDYGKARHGVAASRPPTLKDWQAVMYRFRDVLRQIRNSGPVRSDPKAQRIIARMATVHMVGIQVNMKEVNAQMDLLALRVGELLAARHDDPAMTNRLQAQSSARVSVRANLRFNTGNQNVPADDADARPRRMLLRL